MINEGVDRRVKQLEAQAKQYNMPVDLLLKYQGLESLDQYKELLKPGIITQIQEELIFEAIVKQEKLKLTAADYEKYYEQIAKGQRKDVKEIKASYPKDQMKERFLLFKAHDFVLESAVIKK